MSLMDKEFVPLSEVEIVEALASDANVLVENQGEVRRATLGQIRDVIKEGLKLEIPESPGTTIRIFVDPTAFDSETMGSLLDEWGSIPFISYVDATMVQELINKYKKGYSFELMVDTTSSVNDDVEETMSELKFQGVYQRIAFDYSVILVAEKDQDIAFLILEKSNDADFGFVYGWSTSEEFAKELVLDA